MPHFLRLRLTRGGDVAVSRSKLVAARRLAEGGSELIMRDIAALQVTSSP